MIRCDIEQVGPDVFKATVPEYAIALESKHPETDVCRSLTAKGIDGTMVTFRNGVKSLTIPIAKYSRVDISEHGRRMDNFAFRRCVESPYATESTAVGTQAPEEKDASL